jgi:hypothetical protein
MQAIPAFLTLAVMPLTYSIAYGVVAGLVAYFIINGTNWLLDNVASGAKSLPQWVAHVRQVCCLLLLSTCCLLPWGCHYHGCSRWLQHVLAAAAGVLAVTWLGRPSSCCQRVQLPCYWVSHCSLVICIMHNPATAQAPVIPAIPPHRP